MKTKKQSLDYDFDNRILEITLDGTSYEFDMEKLDKISVVKKRTYTYDLYLFLFLSVLYLGLIVCGVQPSYLLSCVFFIIQLSYFLKKKNVYKIVFKHDTDTTYTISINKKNNKTAKRVVRQLNNIITDIKPKTKLAQISGANFKLQKNFH